jgi:hypothetical protein
MWSAASNAMVAFMLSGMFVFHCEYYCCNYNYFNYCSCGYYGCVEWADPVGAGIFVDEVVGCGIEDSLGTGLRLEPNMLSVLNKCSKPKNRLLTIKILKGTRNM